ncbi:MULTISPECIES: BrnT family toxin [Rhodomicrobium]|uniref:BrnT family toxin n=1 Tax=Rhodomicrobium TaxID=1068 RepID=UPI000B4A6847|nr:MULTISPECIES: BrnT family toxin [Rhodomicrobium]
MLFEYFEWDEGKRRKNLAAHKIDFEDVHGVFEGPFLSKRSDRDGEERWLAIGCLGSQIVAVVYTMRADRCRIISARKARTNEGEAYYQAIKGEASPREN